MAFRKALILLIPLVLGSCAQVGFITGGGKDIYAPAPVEMIPQNESVNFTGNSFEITFDEFIQLKDPLQNVVIVPDHTKLKTTLHHKTVRVEWDQPLTSNTTYVVYFSGAVQDVTESNDSLMTYVFSTGSVIDSIRYTVRVADAFTNDLATNVTVGLFTTADQDKPYYFTKTDMSGTAYFRFIAAGSYYLRAFQDVNNDLKVQPTESVAFRKEAIELGGSISDSIPLRIYSPRQEPKLLSLKVTAPGALLLEANTDLSGSEFLLNGNVLQPESIKLQDNTKALIFCDLKQLSSAEIIVRNTNITDTITARLTERDKTAKIQPVPLFDSGKIGPHEALSYQVNDLISSVDTSRLALRDVDDSSQIVLRGVKIDKNVFTVDFDRNKHKQVELLLQKGAIQTKSGNENEEQKSSVELLYEKDFGVLHIDATGYNEPILLELLKEKAVVRRIALSDSKKADLANILPGDYKIRVISDVNQNRKWDEGDLQTGTQPERVDWFTVPKIRANWEVDVLLSPEK